MYGELILQVQHEKKSAVDIVYLWVDGSDLRWRESRAAAAAGLSKDSQAAMAVFSNVEGRYRDNEELRFSLRALERFFPDHGHVYIVTDGQTPSWLSRSSVAADKLTLIDHRDLIAPQHLPTFDSGNIESYIHRIPNLSERYFYCNDDVFFGKSVSIDDWFFDDGIYLSWSSDNVVVGDMMSPASTSLVNGSRLSKQWLNKSQNVEGRLGQRQLASYTHTPRTFAHGPRPMLKTLIADLELIAQDLFEGVRGTVFRTWDQPTIISDFVQRWALAHGRARIRNFRHLYISTGNLDLDQKLDTLKKFSQQADGLDFFCINDTFDDTSAQDRRFDSIKSALKHCLPDPSRFEN